MGSELPYHSVIVEDQSHVEGLSQLTRDGVTVVSEEIDTFIIYDKEGRVQQQIDKRDFCPDWSRVLDLRERETSDCEIGRGILAWSRQERISDRYGTVYVSDSTADGEVRVQPSVDWGTINSLVGQRGTLTATVLEARESSHVGDFARGFHQQELPEQGEEYTLGTGEFFIGDEKWREYQEMMNPVGVTDGEKGLDTDVLYKLHDSTVALWFLPD
jgi:hypothetical protein